jgi:hypothetical protein
LRRAGQFNLVNGWVFLTASVSSISHIRNFFESAH